MVDLTLRRSALSGWEQKLSVASVEGAVYLREIPFLGMVNLRVDLSARGVAREIEDAIGFALPM